MPANQGSGGTEPFMDKMAGSRYQTGTGQVSDDKTGCCRVRETGIFVLRTRLTLTTSR
jgi:hypothetical protein